MSLEKAVAAKDEAKKLDALLAAWRKKKHPRIADLIDRVSDPLVRAAGGAVKAKSVPERTKLVLSMLRKPNATDVGRVLATEWPGTWDPAMPVVRALCKLPEDPRVAQCFARAVDLTQYVSESAINLYRLVFRRMDELADVRTRELLERQLTRTKNEYYSRNSRKLEERSAAAIAKVKVPELTAGEEKLLAQLEAPFATERATAKERGKSGAELLDAVYANPADLGLRAVYGDWLTQHGDPRGELISLQLAPLTPKSQSRIRSLIKQHWRTWVGPLADWFTFGYSRSPQAPEFKAGFAVSCLVQAPKYDVRRELEKLLEHREWRTVETLVSWPKHMLPLHRALAHPNFAQVRELQFTLEHRDLAPMLEAGVGAQLHTVELWRTEVDPPLPLERLQGVRRLTVRAEVLPHVRVLLPLLESLHVERGELGAAEWKLLEGSGVPRVEYGNLTVSRGKGGAHFTTLERKVAAPTKEEEVALAALPKLKRAEREGPPLLSFDVKAPLRTDALVEATWNVLTTGFGVTFDALDIGGVEHDLTKEPVKRIQVRSRNVKNYYVRLSQRGSPGEVVLLWKDKAEFVIAVRDVERFLAAMRALLALVPKETVVEAGLDGKSAAGTAGAWTRVEKFIGAL